MENTREPSNGSIQAGTRTGRTINRARALALILGGALVGALVTLVVTEAYKKLVPSRDADGRTAIATERMVGLFDTLLAEVREERVSLRAVPPDPERLAETAGRLDSVAENLVQVVARVRNTYAEEVRLPRRQMPPPLAKLPPPTAPLPRSPGEFADSMPEPNVWLRTNKSALIGRAPNSLAVQRWGFGINVDTTMVLVSLNGDEQYMSAGDRLQYPDTDEDCFVVFLRTDNPTPPISGDERHAFALTCSPRAPQ